MKRNKILILAAAAILFMISGLAYTHLTKKEPVIIKEGVKSDISFEKPLEEIMEEEIIMVYILGEVKNAGVYEMKKNQRINDVIEAAGGPTEYADLTKLNLAEHVADEQKIVVPKESTEEAGSEATSVDDGRVNINTADKEKLKSLPGVGDVIADHIIQYREKNGNFKTIDDIKNVTRIGSKTFEKLRDYIKVK